MEGSKNVVSDGISKLKREVDSMDDFEHLGHDSSPLKDMREYTSDFLGLKTDSEAPPARESSLEINTKEGIIGSSVTGSFEPSRNVIDQPLIPVKMDTNKLEGGDSFPDRKEADAKLDKFLQELNPPPQAVIPSSNKDKFDIQSFVDNERGLSLEKATIHSSNDILDRYTDSEPEEDAHKPSKYEDLPKTQQLPESFGSAENLKGDTFKDVDDLLQEPPKQSLPEPNPPKQDPPKQDIPKPDPAKEEPLPKPSAPALEPVTPREPLVQKIPDVREKQPEPPKKALEPEKPKKVEETSDKKTKIAPADAEAIFCKMGLDAWFNPEKLDPKVESLIYWRDPKKSGPVFGGVLLILLALTYFSLISVIAYFSLITLSLTIAFRIYKNVVQAIQKTGDGHPFKEYLDMDLSLSQDKVRELSELVVAHVNAGVVELRRLFLVEDLVDSIKFGVLLWTLTYLGAWFNGMTLIIIAWVALFTLPKVYETNKTQIDANLEIVRTKLAELTTKIKAAIPMGKKTEEKKEQ